jgi:predicted TIM-barrel fold metal-dependent hydrolase
MNIAGDDVIVDAHMHLTGCAASLANIADIQTGASIAAVNLLVLAADNEPRTWLQVPAALLYKLRHPGNYAFGALRYYDPKIGTRRADLAAQAERLRGMGFDGIKLYHGKPTVRRELAFPLDDPVYDGFYEYVSRTGFPVLHHVGDPADLWDPDACPSWARERGWDYSESSFTPRDELYAESERVLAKFPEAPITFAHFYSHASDLPEAERLFRTYPRVSFDLTPGWEMYRHFSARPDEWREFFLRYADRILFGTDNGGGRSHPNPERIAEAVGKVRVIREFLQGETPIQRGERTYTPLGLPADTVKLICGDNFRRVAGRQPRKVDVAAARACAMDLVTQLRGRDDCARADGEELAAALAGFVTAGDSVTTHGGGT